MTLIPKKAPYVTIKNLNSLDLSDYMVAVPATLLR